MPRYGWVVEYRISGPVHINRGRPWECLGVVRSERAAETMQEKKAVAQAKGQSEIIAVLLTFKLRAAIWPN